jgi:hypothetical protein
MNLLEELRFRYCDQRRTKPVQSLLEALFDVGERVLRVPWKERAFSSSPTFHLVYLVEEMLQLWAQQRPASTS